MLGASPHLQAFGVEKCIFQGKAMLLVGYNLGFRCRFCQSTADKITSIHGEIPNGEKRPSQDRQTYLYIVKTNEVINGARICHSICKSVRANAFSVLFDSLGVLLCGRSCHFPVNNSGFICKSLKGDEHKQKMQLTANI